jgi:predicted nuclease of predicted toxin-antitoxin system
MHFVIDAQLPPRLVSFFANRGHDVVHVQDLPGGVTASDADIAAYADSEGAVVITKDDDFRHAHIATGRPRALLLIATGNISNSDLVALLDERVDEVVAAFSGCDFVEVRREFVVVHSRR